MTENESSQFETAAEPSPEMYVVPPEAEPIPSVYQSNGKLFIEHGADLPDQLCICSGKRATKLVNCTLRNPSNPKTWFGRGFQIEVPLSRKHAENAMVGKALTFSVMALGAFLFVIGLIFGTLPAVIAGVVALGISGLFRALVPVTVKDPKADPVEVRSVSSTFLQQFPEVEWEEEEDE